MFRFGFAIKDTVRLEYRSLPNFVFPFSVGDAQRFLERINRCVK